MTFYAQHKKSSRTCAVRDELVPAAGLEPARLLGRGILSPLCLPFHHTGRWEYFSTEKRVRQEQKRAGEGENDKCPVFGTRPDRRQ